MAEARSRRQKRFDYAAISSASFLNSVGSNLHISVWPFYLQRSGVNEAMYGAYSTTSSMVGILARAFSSKLGSYGENIVFVAGIAASSASMLAYAISPGPIAIAMGMALSAVSIALVMIGRTVLVGRSVGTTMLATAYSIIMTLGNVGMIVAANLGVLVFNAIGYQLLFLAGASTCFIAMTVAILFLPRGKADGELRLGLLGIRCSRSVLRWFYLVTALDSFSWSIAMPFFTITPARIFGATKEEIALMQTLIFGASMATNIAVANISDKIYARKRILVLSEILGVICMGLYVTAQSIMPLYASSIIMGLVIATWGPITSAYINEISSREDIQDSVATWMTLTATTRIPGPIIGGLLSQSLNPRAPYALCLALVASAAVMIEKLLVEPKRTRVTSEA